MAAPAVPQGYRADVFVTGLADPYANFKVGVDAHKLAVCWSGIDKPGTSPEGMLRRVWRAGAVWPGNALDEPFPLHGESKIAPDDVWAVPVSWGQPDPSKPCWAVVAPAAVTVDVAASGQAVSTKPWAPRARSSYTPAPTRGGYTPGSSSTRDGGATALDDPAMQAALQKYARKLKEGSYAVVGAFFPSDADATPERIALFEAGADCPEQVNAALKAGILADVIAKATPETLCAGLRDALPKQKSRSSGAGTAVVVGLTALGALWLAARAAKKKRRR